LQEIKPKQPELDWRNVAFLMGSPIIAVILMAVHFVHEGFNPYFLVLFFAFYVITGLSLTAGYHRLFSHRTYKAQPWLELVYLIFGAASFQNSALTWSDDHRRHHLHVDTDNDPYNINRGLFFAHIGWVLYKDSFNERNLDNVKDLSQNPRVQWQHKYYWPLSIMVGLGLPTLIGYFMGSTLGGFVFGGLLRVVVVHHLIFLINSIAHYWGSQTYSEKHSSRDSLLLAFFTYGEGYHNFHHTFESDYRNGVRWFHWDPTKWLIRTMSYVGGANQLKRVNEAVILRAKLLREKQVLATRSPDSFEFVREYLESLQIKIIDTKTRIRQLKAEYGEFKRQVHENNTQRVENLKKEIREAKLEFRKAYSEWRATIALAYRYA